MVQSFRPIPSEPKSGLIEVASNIWTIEAKECVCYRPPMQPRYPYTHRAVVIRLNDDSLFILSPIQFTPNVCADIDQLGVVKYVVSPNHLHHLYMVLSRDTCKNLQDSLETVNIFTFQRLQGPSLLTETELNRIKF